MNNVPSPLPRTSDEWLEKEIQAKKLTAPRVSLQDLNANIESVDYVEFVTKNGQILRWAVLNTLNGFAVTGKPSASVSPENDNQEIGEKVALENAKNELWALMGYELKSRLHRQFKE